MRLLAIPVATVLVALALAACGSNSNPEKPSGTTPGSGTSSGLVPAEDVVRVKQARLEIRSYCEHHAKAHPPVGALSTLVQVYRENPDAIFDSGSAEQDRSMGELLRYESNVLRRCHANDLAARLQQAAGSSG